MKRIAVLTLRQPDFLFADRGQKQTIRKK